MVGVAAGAAVTQAAPALGTAEWLAEFPVPGAGGADGGPRRGLRCWWRRVTPRMTRPAARDRQREEYESLDEEIRRATEEQEHWRAEDERLMRGGPVRRMLRALFT